MGKPAICYETGLDEAFLIGTKDELLALAHALIDGVSAPGRKRDYLGIKTHVVNARLTETMADVVLDGTYVVETETDRQELINRIRVNNGQPPVDWKSRPKNQEMRQQPPPGDRLKAPPEE